MNIQFCYIDKLRDLFDPIEVVRIGPTISE